MNEDGSPNKSPRRVIRYYSVMPTRMDYNTGNLRLQPWYGTPEGASLRVVMEVHDYALHKARVVEAEVLNQGERK